MVSSPSLRSSSLSVGEGEPLEFMATHGNGSGDEGTGLVYRQTGRQVPGGTIIITGK